MNAASNATLVLLCRGIGAESHASGAAVNVKQLQGLDTWVVGKDEYLRMFIIMPGRMGRKTHKVVLDKVGHREQLVLFNVAATNSSAHKH